MYLLSSSFLRADAISLIDTDLTPFALPDAGGLPLQGGSLAIWVGLEEGAIALPEQPAIVQTEQGRLPGVGR